MAAEGSEREPFSPDFADQEDTMADFRGDVVDCKRITRGRRLISAVSLNCTDVKAIDFTDDNNFSKALQAKMAVSRIGAGQNSVRSTPRH